MKERVFGFVFFIFLLSFIVGCSKAPVAVVNGKPISAEAFELAMRAWSGEHNLQNVNVDKGKLKQAVISQLVTERLMLDDAEKKGIKVTDAEVKAEIDSVRQKMGEDSFNKMLKRGGMTMDVFRNRARENMVLKRFKEALGKEIPVNEEEMRDYYRNGQKPFIKPARMFVKVVEMQSEDEARAAVREMRSKKIDFDTMADKLASDGKASTTNYGWVKAGFFSAEIASGLEGLKVGEFGGPFKGKKSFYLIKLKEREKEGIASFEEVRDNIKQILSEQKREEAFVRWFEDKKKSSKVEISLK